MLGFLCQPNHVLRAVEPGNDHFVSKLSKTQILFLIDASLPRCECQDIPSLDFEGKRESWL